MKSSSYLHHSLIKLFTHRDKIMVVDSATLAPAAGLGIVYTRLYGAGLVASGVLAMKGPTLTLLCQHYGRNIAEDLQLAKSGVRIALQNNYCVSQTRHLLVLKPNNLSRFATSHAGFFPQISPAVLGLFVTRCENYSRLPIVD
eukprot:g63829.t1